MNKLIGYFDLIPFKWIKRNSVNNTKNVCETASSTKRAYYRFDLLRDFYSDVYGFTSEISRLDLGNFVFGHVEDFEISQVGERLRRDLVETISTEIETHHIPTKNKD